MSIIEIRERERLSEDFIRHKKQTCHVIKLEETTNLKWV